jgi:hypothetical protein
VSGTVVTSSLNRNKRPPEQKPLHETGGGCQNCSGGCPNCPIKGKAPMQEEIQKAVTAIRERSGEENNKPTLEKESKSILGIKVVATSETIFRLPKSTITIHSSQVPTSIQQIDPARDSGDLQQLDSINQPKTRPYPERIFAEQDKGEASDFSQVPRTMEGEKQIEAKGERLATEYDSLKIDFPIPQNPMAKTISFRTTSQKTVIEPKSRVEKSEKIEIKNRKRENEGQNQIKENKSPKNVQEKDTLYPPEMEKMITQIEEIRVGSNDNARKIVLVQKRESEIQESKQESEIFAHCKKDLPKASKVAGKEIIKLKMQESESKEEKAFAQKRDPKAKTPTTQKMRVQEKTIRTKIAPKEEHRVNERTEKRAKIEKEAKLLTNQITKVVANEKFIKLSFRETRQLETLIKKLLAKKAENKSKKKISIFELLEIFKKVKKKKAKSKLAA